MSRTPAGAATEAATYRRRLRTAEAVVAELQAQLLGPWIAARFANPADFDTFIGRENVTDRDGRILWSELEVRTRALLERRPYLATPTTSDARADSQPGVASLPSGSR